MSVLVGTSGWQYDDWRGTVYPEGVGTGRWLEHYVRWFPTVEVNSTFYRLARRSAVEGWAATAPPGFEFVCKGSQFITHRLHCKDAGPAVERFYEPLEPLAGQLGCVLWQLPPNWRRNVARLDEFCSLLPSTHDHAVEFRDDDWFHPESYDVLDRHGVAHVWLSSSLTERHERVRTGDHVYVRFHGLGEQPYRWDYEEAELRRWADELREVASDGTTVRVFFNNDHEGHAVRNARALVELLGDQAVDWVDAA